MTRIASPVGSLSSVPTGKIVRAMYEPCAVTPLLFVEAAVPAALKVIGTLIRPVWKQDIKLATGKSWLKHLKQYVADGTMVEPTANQAGLNFLFELAEWADKAAWWMFLADVGYEFFSNWHTIAMQMGGCKNDPHHLVTVGNNPWKNYGADPGWQDGPTFTRTSGSGPLYFAPSVDVPPMTTANIMMALSFEPFSDGSGPSFETRLVQNLTGYVQASGAISAEQAAAGESVIVAAQIEGDPLFTLTWEMQVKVSFGAQHSWATPASGTCMISTGGVTSWM